MHPVMAQFDIQIRFVSEKIVIVGIVLATKLYTVVSKKSKEEVKEEMFSSFQHFESQ